MHYVVIKEAIEIPNTNPPRKLSFMEVLRDSLLNHQEQFGTGAAAVRASIKLEKLFSKYKEGDAVPVEDADYTRLRISADTTVYNPVVARHIMPFIDSILDAPTEDPTKKADAEDSSKSSTQNEAVS